ncbi:MAG TPA: imelysin family protein [Acidimicrobiia bacterium]|nr:imelysin family protein [Acidimicrobiia bacterium]
MRRWVCLLMAMVAISCSTEPAEGVVVRSVTDEAIVQSLGMSSAAAAELMDAAERYCVNPAREDVAQVRAAWRRSNDAWNRAILTTWFGPAEMLRTVSRVDYEPVSEEGIDALLASGTTLDADYVLNQAASTERGLGTVEYLLFGSGHDAERARVCELLIATSAVVASETLALEEAWTGSYQGGASFSERFAGEGMVSDDALADVVLSLVETLKQMSLLQLGKALGISAQEPVIDSIPEGAAGAGAASYLAQLEGVRSLLDAGGESSLGTLIAARSEAVSSRIDEELAAGIAELAGIDAPLRQVATDDPARLRPLYDHLSELLRLFEADVVSLLDITLGFSDADGDSG